MFFILLVVVGLVAWALHLMQEAIQRREFSLMLAGFLVSSAAAALMSVYFLVSHYVVYMGEVSHHDYDSALYQQIDWADMSSLSTDEWLDTVFSQTN